MCTTVTVDKTRLKITRTPWSMTFTSGLPNNLQSLLVKVSSQVSVTTNCETRRGWKHGLRSLTLHILLLLIKNKISFIPAVIIDHSMTHLVTPCPSGTSVSAKDHIKFLWSSYTLGWKAIYALGKTDQCIYTHILKTQHTHLAWIDFC